MYFTVRVVCIPPVQLFLPSRGAVQCPKQKAAVGTTVRQSCQIDTVPFSISMGRNMKLMVRIFHDLRICSKGIDIFHSLSKVKSFRPVFREIMCLQLFCEIFISRKRKAKLLIHAKNICQLEKLSVSMYCRRLSNAYYAAPFIYPAPKQADQFFILPARAAGKGRMCISCIDDDIHILRNPMLQNIIKA